MVTATRCALRKRLLKPNGAVGGKGVLLGGRPMAAALQPPQWRPTLGSYDVMCAPQGAILHTSLFFVEVCVEEKNTTKSILGMGIAGAAQLPLLGLWPVTRSPDPEDPVPDYY